MARPVIHFLNANPILYFSQVRRADCFALQWSSRVIAEISRFRKRILFKWIWIISWSYCSK